MTALLSNPTPNPRSIKLLVNTLRKVIPISWSVKFDKETRSVIIKRRDPFLAVSGQPNSEPYKEPELVEYAICYDIQHGISIAEFNSRKQHNLGLKTEAMKLYDILVSRKMTRKFDDFIPRTTEDAEIVKEYKIIKTSFLELPHYYYRDTSLTCNYGGSLRPVFIPAENTQLMECQSVEKKNLSILSSYDSIAQ